MTTVSDGIVDEENIRIFLDRKNYNVSKSCRAFNSRNNKCKKPCLKNKTLCGIHYRQFLINYSSYVKFVASINDLDLDHDGEVIYQEVELLFRNYSSVIKYIFSDKTILPFNWNDVDEDDGIDSISFEMKKIAILSSIPGIRFHMITKELIDEPLDTFLLELCSDKEELARFWSDDKDIDQKDIETIHNFFYNRLVKIDEISQQEWNARDIEYEGSFYEFDEYGVQENEDNFYGSMNKNTLKRIANEFDIKDQKEFQKYHIRKLKRLSKEFEIFIDQRLNSREQYSGKFWDDKILFLMFTQLLLNYYDCLMSIKSFNNVYVEYVEIDVNEIELEIESGNSKAKSFVPTYLEVEEEYHDYFWENKRRRRERNVDKNNERKQTGKSIYTFNNIVDLKDLNDQSESKYSHFYSLVALCVYDGGKRIKTVYVIVTNITFNGKIITYLSEEGFTEGEQKHDYYKANSALKIIENHLTSLHSINRSKYSFLDCFQFDQVSLVFKLKHPEIVFYIPSIAEKYFVMDACLLFFYGLYNRNNVDDSLEYRVYFMNQKINLAKYLKSVARSIQSCDFEQRDFTCLNFFFNSNNSIIEEISKNEKKKGKDDSALTKIVHLRLDDFGINESKDFGQNKYFSQDDNESMTRWVSDGLILAICAAILNNYGPAIDSLSLGVIMRNNTLHTFSRNNYGVMIADQRKDFDDLPTTSSNSRNGSMTLNSFVKKYFIYFFNKNNNHWIVLSNIKLTKSKDSRTLSDNTIWYSDNLHNDASGNDFDYISQVISNLNKNNLFDFFDDPLKPNEFNFIPYEFIPEQPNGNDCGILSVYIMIALVSLMAYDKDEYYYYFKEFMGMIYDLYKKSQEKNTNMLRENFQISLDGLAGFGHGWFPSNLNNLFIQVISPTFLQVDDNSDNIDNSDNNYNIDNRDNNYNIDNSDNNYNIDNRDNNYNIDNNDNQEQVIELNAVDGMDINEALTDYYSQEEADQPNYQENYYNQEEADQPNYQENYYNQEEADQPNYQENYYNQEELAEEIRRLEAEDLFNY